MGDDFLQTVLGKTGLPVHRVGLSATYRPWKDTVRRAIEEGLNYFFSFGIDARMTKVLKKKPVSARGQG